MTVTQRKRAKAPTQPVGRWIRPAKRLAIYLRDGFRCAYCGADLTGAAPRAISLDHVIPRERGGSNHERNLVTACSGCNATRRHRSVRQFRPDAWVEVVRRVNRPLGPSLDLARAILSGEAPAVETRPAAD